MNYLFILWIFLISLGINYIFFVVAYFLKTDLFTDLTYSMTFTFISTVLLIWCKNFSVYQIAIYVLVNLWAIRIGFYLGQRIAKIKVDHRFDNLRNSFVKFLGFWTLQAISVMLIGLPAFFSLTINQSYFNVTNYLFLIFLLLAIVFLGLESWADYSKFYFYNRRKNKTDFVKTGIWKYSRHPNYFAEISFWFMVCSLFIFGFLITNSISITKNALFILWFLSPIYLMLLINFVSGVPLLEKRSAKTRANIKEYQDYVKKTPCVIPFIGLKRKDYLLKT